MGKKCPITVKSHRDYNCWNMLKINYITPTALTSNIYKRFWLALTHFKDVYGANHNYLTCINDILKHQQFHRRWLLLKQAWVQMSWNQSHLWEITLDMVYFCHLANTALLIQLTKYKSSGTDGSHYSHWVHNKFHWIISPLMVDKRLECELKSLLCMWQMYSLLPVS